MSGFENFSLDNDGEENLNGLNELGDDSESSIDDVLLGTAPKPRTVDGFGEVDPDNDEDVDELDVDEDFDDRDYE
jgi:hypothetical protein